MKRSFMYDEMNRLTQMLEGSTQSGSMTYDGLGLMTPMDLAVTETGLAGTVSRSLTYLMGPFGVFAVVEQVNGTETLHYVLKDNLCSWTVITDADGIVEQRLSYDAWGNLRNPQQWTNYASGDISGKPMFDRGFTGHEHLTYFGLINMNGRMYDPVMSSFLSVDRFIQNPLSAQGLNPYAYCMYNPLRYVDPTGWAPRPGGGNGPDNPLPQYLINGQVSYMLPEITITPYEDRPPTFTEYVYTPYSVGGGGGESNYGNPDNIPTFNQGGGGGGGNHGGGSNLVVLKQKETSMKLSPSLQMINSTMFIYDGIVWTSPSKLISIDAGQHVRIEIVNNNLLGVQLSIHDVTSYHYETNSLGVNKIVYSGDGYGTVLPSGVKASYDFYRFDYSPIHWTFQFGTDISETTNIKINIYSEWKPGMSIDPNHPSLKKK